LLDAFEALAAASVCGTFHPVAGRTALLNDGLAVNESLFYRLLFLTIGPFGAGLFCCGVNAIAFLVGFFLANQVGGATIVVDLAGFSLAVMVGYFLFAARGTIFIILHTGAARGYRFRLNTTKPRATIFVLGAFPFLCPYWLRRHHRRRQ
jgi:hypothetical protein